MHRREVLKTAFAGTVALSFPSLLRGQTDKIAILHFGEGNVLALPIADGLVLVDSGAPQFRDQVTAAVKGKVVTLFNTHHHLEQTGNNEMFSAAGAKIIAHKRTLEWMSSDHWRSEEHTSEL